MTTQISTIASNSDFKVNMKTGEAFISQRKTAEITGIPKSTVNDWILKEPDTYNLNENNQLDAKSLQKLVLTGHLKGYEKCADLMEKLMEAGATAFICHMAGVPLKPDYNNVPLTYKESLQRLLDNEIERERLQEVIQKQTVVIDHKKIRTDDSMTHTTMVRVRKLNPNETFSSARLIAYCEDNEINIEKVYDAHDQPVNSYPNAAWEAVYPDVVLPAHL